MLKPALHVHVAAPDELVELAGQSVQVDAPAALNLPALQAVRPDRITFGGERVVSGRDAQSSRGGAHTYQCTSHHSSTRCRRHKLRDARSNGDV